MKITEPTPCRHWHPRHGYCVLWAYPPAHIEGLGKHAAARAARQRKLAVIRQFVRRHGYSPDAVLCGTGGVAVGPVEGEENTVIDWKAVRRKGEEGLLTADEALALCDMAEDLEDELLQSEPPGDACPWCWYSNGHMHECPYEALETIGGTDAAPDTT